MPGAFFFGLLLFVEAKGKGAAANDSFVCRQLCGTKKIRAVDVYLRLRFCPACTKKKYVFLFLPSTFR